VSDGVAGRLTYFDRPPHPPSLLHEVIAGLPRPYKQLPSKLFHDNRRAAFFEAICHLSKCYLTRSEISCGYEGADIQRLAGRAGFTPRRFWIDQSPLLSIHASAADL
jgi:uncharacterized SAM-dependent methyltransferase